jgi:predicted dehydrogenase
MSKKISRRTFVENAGKVAMGAMIVPRHVLGGPGFRAPSATLNVAIVGAGGQGMEQFKALLRGGQNVVAIADVDFPYVERNITGQLNSNNETTKALGARVKESYDKAKKYADFREMFDKGAGEFDAVVVATPDHSHAQVAVRAMKAGKHVYVQKPLTYSVYESRLLRKVAAESKVVTQMGNQGHSGDGTRRIVEIVASGVLGTITEAHIWTDRPVNYWAQGIPRPWIVPPNPPADRGYPEQWAMGTINRAVATAMMGVTQTPPPGLNWELFLGCSARNLPYHPVYHPFSWRGWVDFGVGALGDMGAHLIDQTYWALGLTQPTTIVASSSLWGTGQMIDNDGKPVLGQNGRPVQEPQASYPLATNVQYRFPAVGNRPEIKLFWYDGGLLPPRCDFIPEDFVVRGDGGGGMIIGTKGALTYETYGNNPNVFPKSVADAAAQIPQSVPRIQGGTGGHVMNWANASMGEGTASSPFEYGTQLNETMVLGVAALRAGQGKVMHYDAARMEFTNAPDANKFLTREYRKGWEL